MVLKQPGAGGVTAIVDLSDIVRHERGTIVGMEPLPHIDHLVWDEWNRQHLTKHGVTADEVERVIAGDPSVRATYKNRLQVVGPATAGRMLSVVIGPAPAQPDVYYVFSARPASRKERAAYASEKGGRQS